MDLRPFIKDESQVHRARGFVIRGFLNYRPFVFTDDLQTGVGYEFLEDREGEGLVYWPTIDRECARTQS